jgi:hypothetical protein
MTAVPGLSIDLATGVITGTPTQAGTFAFTVTASNGFLPDATQALSIEVAAAAATTTAGTQLARTGMDLNGLLPLGGAALLMMIAGGAAVITRTRRTLTGTQG